MKIAVLGCGPAGLLATHAVFTAGWSADIYSRPEKSVIMGAQYLHKPIPDLTKEPDGVLRYLYLGTRKGYAAKVYGNPEADCSWKQFPDEVEYWTMQNVYEDLWDRYGYRVLPEEVTEEFLYHMVEKYDMVINSVPLKRVVSGKYSWRYEEVWIAQESWTDDDTILYNGLDEDPWYRSSVIAGYGFTEYTEPPDEIECKKILKPLSVTPEPWPGIVKVGRYGRWEKSVLVHEAYENVYGLLAS